MEWAYDYMVVGDLEAAFDALRDAHAAHAEGIGRHVA
jgi:hypothetical protein